MITERNRLEDKAIKLQADIRKLTEQGVHSDNEEYIELVDELTNTQNKLIDIYLKVEEEALQVEAALEMESEHQAELIYSEDLE